MLTIVEWPARGEREKVSTPHFLREDGVIERDEVIEGRRRRWQVTKFKGKENGN